MAHTRLVTFCHNASISALTAENVVSLRSAKHAHVLWLDLHATMPANAMRSVPNNITFLKGRVYLFKVPML